MKNKVCMITTNHSALDDRIFYKEARSLHNAGFDVTLIAPLNKDGFLTDMGNKPIAKEETLIDGIRIIGFRKGKHSLFGLPKTWSLSQWLRLLAFGRLNLGQEPFSDIINKCIQIDADIYHCHEIWSLYAGIKVKQSLERKGKKPALIYDAHEFWSVHSAKTNRKGIWNNLVKHFEKKACLYVDYVFTVNQIIRGYFVCVNNVLKVEVLYNCSELSIFKEYDQKINQDKITICHEGSLDFSRGLKEMLGVMKVLKDRYNGKFRFLIIGDVFGEEKRYFDEKIKEYQIGDVIETTGWLPYEKVGEVISDCSIGIITMNPTMSENKTFIYPIKISNIHLSTPNKLFNYMRYGLPIVTVDLPEIRRIILESQCGIVVKERTVDALVKALSMLIEDADLRQRLGENGRKAVYEKYNWEVMEKRLLRVYNELTSSDNYIIAND